MLAIIISSESTISSVIYLHWQRCQILSYIAFSRDKLQGLLNFRIVIWDLSDLLCKPRTSANKARWQRNTWGVWSCISQLEFEAILKWAEKITCVWMKWHWFSTGTWTATKCNQILCKLNLCCCILMTTLL